MRGLVRVALVAALFISAPAFAGQKCLTSVSTVIEQTAKLHPELEFNKLNDQQLETFRKTEGLAPKPDRVPVYDGVVIMHDQVKSMVIITLGRCVVGMSHNTTQWQKLAKHLGFTRA